MEQYSAAAGYTHSNNINESNPSEQRNIRFEKGTPAYYGQCFVSCHDSTADGYPETESAVVTVQYSGAKYLHSKHDNYAYFPQKQAFDMEESIPTSSGQPSLEDTDLNSGLYHMSQTTTPTKHYSDGGFSHLRPGNSIYPSLEGSGFFEKFIPIISEQSYEIIPGISQNIYPSPQTVLPSFQHAFGKLRTQGTIDQMERRSNNNNTYIQQPGISPHFESNASKNHIGKVGMKQIEKIPYFETVMQPRSGTAITQECGINSIPSSACIQKAHSVSQSQGLNLDDTLQNESGTYMSSHMLNTEYDFHASHMPNTENDLHTSHMPNRYVAEPAKYTLNISKIARIKNEETVFRRTEDYVSCIICETLLRKRYLRRHWQRHHIGFTFFKCSICNKTFSASSQLKEHEKRYTTIYACDECGFRSCRKSALARHKLIHSEETSFVCDKCKQPFKSGTCLTRHLNRRHSNT